MSSQNPAQGQPPDDLTYGDDLLARDRMALEGGNPTIPICASAVACAPIPVPQRPTGNRAGPPARGALVIDPERSPDRGRCADAAPMSERQTTLGAPDSMPVRKGPGTAHFANRDMTQRLVAPPLDFGGTPSMCVVVSIGETDGHHCFKLHGAQQRQARS
jgi:hypothetical protein